MRVSGRGIRRRTLVDVDDVLRLKPRRLCSWFNEVVEIGIGHSHFNENAPLPDCVKWIRSSFKVERIVS